MFLRFSIFVVALFGVAAASWGASLGMSTEAVDQTFTDLISRQDSFEIIARSQSIQRDGQNVMPTAYDKYMDYFHRAQLPSPCTVAPSYSYKIETVHDGKSFSGKEVVTRKYILNVTDGKNRWSLEMFGNYWASRVSTYIKGHSVSKFFVPVDSVINQVNGVSANSTMAPRTNFAITWIVDEDYVIHSFRVQVAKAGEYVSLKTAPEAFLGDLVNCHD